MHATRLRAVLVLALAAGLGVSANGAYAVLHAGGGAGGATLWSNSSPEANPDEINTAKGTPGDTDVIANDVDLDGDTLTVQSFTQGTDGSVGCSDTVCVYTPTDPSFSGSDSFTYTVSDGHGGTDVGDVFVTVTTSNEQPVADDDFLTVDEDSFGSLDVLDGDTDDDGDPLEVTSLAPLADHGTVECSASGVCTYTPDPSFSGSDAFLYEIDDGEGGADTGEVFVTVTAVNDAPDAVNDSLTVFEDEQGSLNVRTNDTDVDGDTLLVTTLTPSASHGSVTCLAGGGCTYTPDADYNGPDSFQYTISDGHGGTDSATVTITVAPENTAPVADDETLTTAEDTAGPVNVLVGDTDVDGDSLSVSSPAPTAAHGTVSCTTAGVCTYTPATNYNGADSFEYTLADARGKSDTGQVTVTVNPANDAPGAVDDLLTTAEETQGQLDVLTNDGDIDGDTPSVTGKTNGAHGLVVCAADGTCTYTPVLNYVGADTFTYTISDGHGGTDVGSVAVTVTQVNDAPVADDESLTVVVDTPTNVNVLTGDTDVDGDTLSVDATSDPDHGAVSCNATSGVCTYTPDAAYLGPDSFTYTVGDGEFTDEGLVSVTVEEADVSPTCANVKPSKTKLWPPQHQFIVVVLSGATDPDADPLTYAITSVTQDEKTKLNASDKKPDAQRIAGKPNQIKLRAERDLKANGRVYRVFYTVSDGRGGTCTGVEKVGVPVKQTKKAVETAKSFNSFG